MSIKKFAVIKYEYEYNDNWYSHDNNINSTIIPLFDHFKDADECRKKLSFEEIFKFPTDGNFQNVIPDSKIEYSDISSILNEYKETECDEDDYKLRVHKKTLPIAWDKLYPVIKELYFIIKELDFDDNCIGELKWESDYNITINRGIIENDTFLLHSISKPATVEVSKYTLEDNNIDINTINETSDDYEIYVKYYLKGEALSKKDWVSKSRKFKIDKLD